MGRPDQGNKAQTPVGYSHGTGASTGGLATAVREVDARVTPGVHGFVWGRQVDRMAGVQETAWRSGRSAHGGYAEFKIAAYWRHGGMRGGTGDRMVGVRGGTGDRMVGVRGGTGDRMAGVRSGTGDRMMGVRGGTGDRAVDVRGDTGDRMVGVRGGTGEPYCGGATGLHGGTGVSP